MTDSKDRSLPAIDILRQDLSVIDDVLAMSTPEDRAKVRSWFESPSEWSHGSLTAQFGPRSIPLITQDFPTIKPCFNPGESEKFMQEWDKVNKASHFYVGVAPPRDQDIAAAKRWLEETIHREMKTLIEANRFEERLSSSWEHLPCVTTGLHIPIPPEERHFAKILKAGGPR